MYLSILAMAFNFLLLLAVFKSYFGCFWQAFISRWKLKCNRLFSDSLVITNIVMYVRCLKIDWIVSVDVEKTFKQDSDTFRYLYCTFLVIFKQSVSIYKMNVSFINQALFEKSYLICSLRYVLILPRASTPRLSLLSLENGFSSLGWRQ